MYKSPIEVMRTQMHRTIEDEILKEVYRVGVIVDKEELVKALEYDRRQYLKGYRDGFEDGRKEAACDHLRELEWYCRTE